MNTEAAPSTWTRTCVVRGPRPPDAITLADLATPIGFEAYTSGIDTRLEHRTARIKVVYQALDAVIVAAVEPWLADGIAVQVLPSDVGIVATPRKSDIDLIWIGEATTANAIDPPADTVRQLLSPIMDRISAAAPASRAALQALVARELASYEPRGRATYSSGVVAARRALLTEPMLRACREARTCSLPRLSQPNLDRPEGRRHGVARTTGRRNFPTGRRTPAPTDNNHLYRAATRQRVRFAQADKLKSSFGLATGRNSGTNIIGFSPLRDPTGSAPPAALVCTRQIS